MSGVDPDRVAVPRTARANARVMGWNVVTLGVFGSTVCGVLLGIVSALTERGSAWL